MVFFYRFFYRDSYGDFLRGFSTVIFYGDFFDCYFYSKSPKVVEIPIRIPVEKPVEKTRI
jgi:hypothetical protein